MEIIPGVHTIEKLGVGRAYLYVEADRLTLIDTGLAGSTAKLLAAIESTGHKPEALAQVFVTHHHRDHTGSLAEVVERTNAQVLAHPIDARVVRGEVEPPAPSGGGPLRALIARSNTPPPPVRVDREVGDGDEVDLDGGARVVHVPGHTAGSIALYVPGRKLLFSGDAATNTMGLGPPSGPFGMFNEDRQASRASFRKLAELDFEVACFGHGAPLDKEASLAFRRAVEKL